MVREDQIEWVTRVLGVPFAGDAGGERGTAGQPAPSALDAGAVWRTAKEAADERLNQLASKMRETGDPDLVRIADFGLFGISNGGKGLNVALNKALIEYAGANAERRQQAAEKLRKATQAYRSALSSNEVIKLVDGNPFGVNVALSATLGAALDTIETSL